MDPFDGLAPAVQLWFLSLAFSDMNKSEEAARSAIHLIERGGYATAHCEALVEIAIIRYVRPHTNCNMPIPPGRVRLPDRFIPVEQRLRDTHRLVLEIRDQTAAHSDLGIRDAIVRRVPLNGALVWQSLTSTNTLHPPAVSWLADLCIAVRKLLLPAIRETADTLLPAARAGQCFELRLEAEPRLVDCPHLGPFG
jgi:hypothetical protein